MPRRAACALALALAAVAACGPPAGPTPVAPAPPPVVASPVTLPAGARPEVIAADGDALLVGVHRDGAAQPPGLLRLAPGGALSDVPAAATSGYGRTASWYSLAVGAGGITAVGGDRGGAHGNVRWSVWTGGDAGVAEQGQAFSTFGGWGAGDLADAVPTATGPVVVGSWQSDSAGMDVAVWTTDGTTWTRRTSTGTPLGSTPDALGFPIHATADGPGVLVAGWELATARAGRQAPVVWRSATGADGWTRTPLPGADAPGVAVNARCTADGCAVAGRVGGRLALWRETAGTWTRVAGVPDVPVGDDDALAAPLPTPDGIEQVVADGGHVEVLAVTAAGVTVRPLTGPTGTVTAAIGAAGATYVLAGPDRDTLTLWRLP